MVTDLSWTNHKLCLNISHESMHKSKFLINTINSEQ